MTSLKDCRERAAGDAKAMIEVERINCYYGDSHVLFDVSLGVREREVVALLGRNGAGKSTTLKTLAGRCIRAPAPSASKASPSNNCQATRSPASACSWCRKNGAFLAD